MASLSKKYIAKAGINFDGLKGKPRTEPGEPLPEGVSQKEIEQLVKDGFVEEVKPQIEPTRGRFVEDKE